MHIDAFLWMFLPVFVAGGSALLSFYIMQAKLEVAISKERETLAEARATINTHKLTLEDRVKATEEATKRQALDDFMQEFRIEERSYVRDSKSLTASKKSMVMQERLFFRNIPLSNWIEHEMVVEEGADLDQLPRESVFASPANVSSIEEGRLPISKMLDEFPMPVSMSGGSMSGGSMSGGSMSGGSLMPKRESASLIPTRAVAFGAQ